MAEVSARGMQTGAILDEVWRLRKQWDELCAALEESGGMSGSPGEWLVERMDELETELRRRGYTIDTPTRQPAPHT